MNKHRHGEEDPIPFRSGRFFNIETSWYFARRGELDADPFDFKNEAEAALLMYVREINTFNETIINQFKLKPAKHDMLNGFNAVLHETILVQTSVNACMLQNQLLRQES